MRVVAGTLRGRRLDAPDGQVTRPTTDKVREAVFNALASLDLLRDARIADLYAGSGALGIEALSRGAAQCTFIERDRRALRTIRTNLDSLGLAERSRVVAGDALALAPSVQADLVLIDPPYGFDRWEQLLGALDAPMVVVEADQELDEAIWISRWELLRSKRYGRTWVMFLAARHDPATPLAPQ